MFDFSGKVVIVTGSSGNLGRAVAHAFLTSGARAALFDRLKGEPAELFPDLSLSEAEALPVEVDLTDSAAVATQVAAVVSHFGRLDILVNTAGGYRGHALTDTSPEEWDFLMNLNARTVFNTCRAALPYLVDQGAGKIINIAARAALAGKANMAVYTAAKSAVVRLTEGIAEEVKGRGVNVNCILPGTLDTPQNRQARPDEDHSRWVTPEDLAEVILFLASDAARAIHGAAIPVYGLS